MACYEIIIFFTNLDLFSVAFSNFIGYLGYTITFIQEESKYWKWATKTQNTHAWTSSSQTDASLATMAGIFHNFSYQLQFQNDQAI